MAEGAVDLKYYAPVFKIEVNGKALKQDISNVILSVTVEQELATTNSFSFVVQDEFKGGKFRWLGSDLFKLGNNVSVKLGYTGIYKKLIEGKIQNFSASFFEGGSPTITVDGSDSGYEILTAKSKSHVFPKKKDSDIVREIARLTNLAFEIDETSDKPTTKTKKGGTSYLDFIKERAKSISYDFYLLEKKMFFIKSDKNKEVLATLKWGTDLISFKPELNTTKVATEVIVRSWDKVAKKSIVGRAKAGDEDRQDDDKKLASQIVKQIYGDVVKEITDRVVNSVAEANKLAKSELNKLSKGFLTGSGSTIGNPELKPGYNIQLEGLGDLFSGIYKLTKVTHSSDSGGFTTNFEVEKNSA